MSDDTEEFAELVRLHRKGREYLQALKDHGLWGYPHEVKDNGLDYYRQKMNLQREFMDEAMPMFFLDKVETKAHADELTDELVEEHGGNNSLTEDTFFSKYWGRPNHDRDMPDMILTLIEHDALTPDATASLLTHAWVSTEFPAQNGDPERWVDCFNGAGGWVSDDGSERPTEPIRLYRGSALEHANGMSWTADVDKARWFANRFGAKGEVFWSVFQPHELLAHFTGRNEDEYVVDTLNLDNLDRIKTLSE